MQSNLTRQSVEHGLSMINNRVSLLQKEEDRLLKMITETRRKAQRLSEIKERNDSDYRSKVEYKRQEHSSLELQRDATTARRAESDRLRQQSVKSMLDRNHGEWLDM